MTSVSSSFAMSMNLNLYPQKNQAQNPMMGGGNGPDPQAMLMGMGMIFAGMDMLDNGAMDGSIFKQMGGMNQQNNSIGQQQPNNMATAQAQPNGAQAQAGGAPQQNQNNPADNQMQQNPMMQMFMQMMQMLMQMMMQMMGMNPQQAGQQQQNPGNQAGAANPNGQPAGGQPGGNPLSGMMPAMPGIGNQPFSMGGNNDGQVGAGNQPFGNFGGGDGSFAPAWSGGPGVPGGIGGGHPVGGGNPVSGNYNHPARSGNEVAPGGFDNSASLPSGVGARALAIGENQLGANEADGSYRKFGQPGPWCAAFVDWSYKQATGGNVPWKGENFHYCPNIEKWAKKNGVWENGNNPQTIGQNVKPGDMVLFDWQRDGKADHIGMVSKLNPDGSMETLEGNTSDAVRHRKYAAGDKRIKGFLKAHELEERGAMKSAATQQTPPSSKETRPNTSPGGDDVRGDSGVSADKLNSHLKGALAGHGQTFVDAGKQNGIDPAFLAALSMHETGNGSSSAVRNKNNAMGICGNGGPKRFDSVDSSIHSAARNLKKNYVDKGLTSVSQIQKKYSPVGAKNDPGFLVFLYLLLRFYLLHIV